MFNDLCLNICLLVFAWLYGFCMKSNLDINEVIYKTIEGQSI